MLLFIISSIIIIIVILCLLTIYNVYRTDIIQSFNSHLNQSVVVTDNTLRVTLCQPIRSPHSVTSAVDNLERYAQQASTYDSDLLLLPELYLGGYLLDHLSGIVISRNGLELRRVSRIAKRFRLVIILGYAEYQPGLKLLIP